MRRPRLLLDCDGVLVDFIGPALQIVEELTGRRFRREDVDQFNMMAALGITPELEQRLWARFKEQGWCASLPPFPGAAEGLARLEEFADVFIVTSPMSGPYWTWEREQSLLKHFGVPAKRIVPTSAKFIVAGDAIVDDKTQTLCEWEKAFPGLAVQWMTPHNVNDGWQGLQTNNWNVLYGMVRGFWEGLRRRVA